MSITKNKHKTLLCRTICKDKRKRRCCGWAVWLWPLAGFASFIWFLVRVIPKPTRATYPCQRVAAPLASAFVVWLAGLIGSTFAYRKARLFFKNAKYVLASIFLVAAVIFVWVAISVTDENKATAYQFAPIDPPNTPIGVGKGIHPGRVVWVYEPNATKWDGQTGDWWDEDNTDIELVDLMVSQAVRSVTGEPNDSSAWDALFRYSNRTRGHGDICYKQGEKIAIKINMNQDDADDGGPSWRHGAGMPSPGMIHSLLDQLIHVVHVPGKDITIYDVSKYIGDPIYNKIKGDPDPQFQNVRFVVRPVWAKNGRESAMTDPNGLVYFSDANVPQGYVCLPRCVTEAKYLINMALLRSHGISGVTLCGKNHFGSFYFPDYGWGALPLHDFIDRNNPMGSYNCLVDLMGHEHLGAKTLLYMIDALYPARDQSTEVVRFKSFGDDWCSSLFVSQDPVAIDSVGIDFLRNEPMAYDFQGSGVDNYLHEAALAHNPPSGTFYDPENDGICLESLGVHEHWNNPVDKRYSRNLGIADGIELVAVRPANVEDYSSETPADLTGDGFVNANDLVVLVRAWLSDADDLRWDALCNFSADERVNFNDWAWFSSSWMWESD